MTIYIVSSGQSPSQVASAGDVINVLSGGVLTSGTILSGGSAIISGGGIDSGSTIVSGGSELVYGSANGDVVAGTQTVSTAATNGVVTSETVVSGGVVFLSIKNTSAFDTTVDGGGALNINGSISATNTTLSGGTVDLESAKATLTGSLIFSGGGTLEVTGNTSAGSGDLAVISGFAAGDVIDMTAATTIGAATLASFTTAVSGGNTVVTVSGGGATDIYLFSGTAIGASLALVADNSGGHELAISGSVSAITSVGGGATVSNVVVSSGSPLTVYSGGTIVSATVLSGGLATVSAGGIDSSTNIQAGGSEVLLGSANGDLVYGSQTLSGGSAVATNETVEAGGVVSVAATGATVSGAVVLSGATLNVSGGGTAANTTVQGGTVNLLTAADTLAGSLDFNGPGTLDILAASNPGAGDQAVISGFYAGDTIDIAAFGVGATLSTVTSGSNTVVTVTSGGASETLTFAGSVASSLALSTASGVAQVTYAGPPTTTSYTPGDLVLSIYGDGSGTGSYTLDQAAPITLEEITPSGSIVSDQELPQSTTVANGVTEYAISGEYESASEGVLTLSVDGKSLTIAGYGVSATSFDAADAETVYGTTALGQTTSVLGGPDTAVERVVADIGYNGSVDTSTSLNDIFNTNNPRSVFTVNGTTFYLSGQGNGADGTEGVFVVNDGASTATAIYDTTTDTRQVVIYNGELYVSIDSKLNGGGGIYDFGTTLPTSATAPVELQGLGTSIVLQAGQANSVNASAVGASVNLSPEQYFFANPDTLYVADGGDPKEGGLGDGGLQKWSLINNVWTLDYTLSEGLNQVPDSDADGTTGLIGLTGTVEGGNVILYASNETVAETDQTYLYGITDSLASTSLPSNESFTLLETAAPDTLIRGVAFAPTSSSTVPVVSTSVVVSGGVTSSGLSIGSGGSITVLTGNAIAGTTLLSGGSATISAGGLGSASFIAQGAKELVLGSANLDIVGGTQLVSAATAIVTNEIVENGGSLDLFLAGAIASGTTVNSEGGLYVSGHAYADNTVVSGGTVELESAKSVIGGTFTFVGGGGVLEETAVISAISSGASFGDQAVISGLGAGDAIDLRAFTSGVLATSVVSGNVVATVTSGTSVQSFTLAGSSLVSGSAYMSGLSLVADNAGGVEILYTPPPPVTLVVSGGQSSGGLSIGSNSIITVLSGGIMSGIEILSGGSAVISAGGEDYGTTISVGGTEVVSGDATGDQVYGLQNVTTGTGAGTSAATIENETVFNGGTVELYLKPDVATNIVVSSGGDLLLSGNVSATNTTLEAGGLVELQSPKAVLNGGFVFSGAADLEITGVTSTTFGDLAVITGFKPGDIIDETVIGGGAIMTSSVVSGNTVETITSGTGMPVSFTFSGTYPAGYLNLVPDGGTGVEIVAETPCYCPGTLIRTDRGEIAVENLKIGDRLVTVSGAARPIRWIGRRSYAGRFLAANEKLWPIVIRAGALAENTPSRDLYVSPRHSIYLDGLLVPAGCLTNGASIERVGKPKSVEYFHLELETHDVIFAEGAAAESFIDDDSRGMFHNAASFGALYPSMPAGVAAVYCAPRVSEGYAVEAIRRRLGARAGVRAMAAGAPLRGQVDRVGRGIVEGWAQNPDCAEAPVCLDIFVDGVVVAQTLANVFRADLVAAGIGGGRHGFVANLPEAVAKAASVEVRRAADGAVLPRRGARSRAA